MDARIKVMIADDFQILVEDLKELIDAQPDMMVVATATSGKEITKLAMEIEHDIILMDIEMENTTAGITAAEKIRDWNKNTKIIYLTAHETKDIILTAMGTGAVDYIVKGIDDQEILNHIRNAYKGITQISGKIQKVVMQEYSRLKQSEKSLLYFIHTLAELTKTERELIGLLLEQKKIKEIAQLRGVEVATVKSQINTLLKKFGASRTKEVTKTIESLHLTHLF